MKISCIKLLAVSLLMSLAYACSSSDTEKPDPEPKEAGERWSVEKANQWYEEKGWLVGANYTPRTAINQLEMWQAETFDPETIEQELGWAEDLGFNTMRVYLHDLAWKNDKEGFIKRIDQFLDIADSHDIGIMFVLLDGVWHPNPEWGKQPEPTPHVHNSGWVQSPGAEVLSDTTKWGYLEDYVKGVLTEFGDDERVYIWDIFNEPDNTNDRAYGDIELDNKKEQALKLLKKSFKWAREANPTQPITSGLWYGDWCNPDSLKAMDKFMLEHSDVITFHAYEGPKVMRERIEALKRYNRPMFCTEYMARPRGSTFENELPVLKEHNVGAYNWGFVNGKTQTIYPWDSWDKEYTSEPNPWFHDILRADGTPYDSSETALIKEHTVE
ncbi:cellulase family glycosylhydrolase [Fodinibius salsisoli]|uniref:Cellulase family glycosylhydrolase n=1 Tax=Fodinibius salsisoli TaxID=2820877 RepID=A0ABT3PQJ7_9BACT|nr:cellulase family glycosylhydrolase [Fodinibius salsisoli]MCW9708130.1 cellulase family glycosylhydrolase [Fodinibius salsisoli]